MAIAPNPKADAVEASCGGLCGKYRSNCLQYLPPIRASGTKARDGHTACRFGPREGLGLFRLAGDQGDRVRRDALFAANKAQLFRGRGLDIDAPLLDTQIERDIGPHPIEVR